MSSQGLIITIVVGIIAGWLAGQIVRGTGYGLINDLVIGVIGAFIGDWLLPRLGIYLGAGILGEIISAAIGAIILLLILRLVRGGGRWRGGRGSVAMEGKRTKATRLRNGADGGGRTRTALRPKDFKSFASTSFATPAREACLTNALEKELASQPAASLAIGGWKARPMSQGK